MRYYYVYYSFEVGGLGYIGHRGCSCLPEEDISYFGTFKHKSFFPDQKIILSVHVTRAQAIAEEIRQHELWGVDKNSGFANLARQTSVRFMFDPTGTKRPDMSEKMKGSKNPLCTPEGRKAASERMKGPNNPGRKMKGDAHPMKRPDLRRKQSENMTGQKNHRYGTKSPDHSEYMSKKSRGCKHWVNAQGERKFQRESPGPEWQNGRVYRSE